MPELNDYFDRARQAEPPISKDEVSNILAERLSERLAKHQKRENAHNRGIGAWMQGFRRTFLQHSLKGWIMISLLTGAVVTFITMTMFTTSHHQIQNDKPFSQQQTHQEANAITPKAAQKRAESLHVAATRITSTLLQNTTDTIQQASTIPEPYSFIEVDDPPAIDISDLQKKVVYPEALKTLGLEGKVNVRVLVLADGTISPRSFVEYSDVHLFDSLALQAVRVSRWKAAERGGKTVPCWVSVPVVYCLRERAGTSSVAKAQMLTLTEEELVKIGVEPLEEDVLQVLGWKKSREDMLQMRVSIKSNISPKMMTDSVFYNYVHNLRKQGKYKLAEEWEQVRWTQGKRSIHGLLNDSVLNLNQSGLTTIVTSKRTTVNVAELRNKARQFSLPRLVTDGHNYRYFIDVSDAPALIKMRTSRQEVEAFSKRAKSIGLPLKEIQDSIRRISAYYYNDSLDKKIRSSRDSVEITRLVVQKEAQRKQEELQFEQEKSDINKLIGIRIPSKTAVSKGDEYLLWYDPTPEFVALLPERYRTGLQRELAVAEKYATKCEIPTEEEKKAVPGYFDSWRSCDGVLAITNIFPNPVNINATVRFRLQETRQITITVHNLNGERLAILDPTPLLGAGEHELPLDFTGRNIGVYLLALSTDKGETAIKRVMIVR